MDIDQAIEIVRDSQANPNQLAGANMFLAAEYALTSALLTDVLIMKADQWNTLRQKHGSDKQADKAWDATDEGKNETTYRLKLKSLEKVMSAIRTRLRVMDTEARNLI